MLCSTLGFVGGANVQVCLQSAIRSRLVFANGRRVSSTAGTLLSGYTSMRKANQEVASRRLFSLFSASNAQQFGGSYHRRGHACLVKTRFNRRLPSYAGDCRFLSTKGDDKDNSDQEVKPILNVDNRESGPGARIRTIEPDFASLVTGEVEPPVQSTIFSKETRRRRRTERYLQLDADKELYNQIRIMQNMQKEKSRLKTARNVHRALWGNLAICVAKLGAWMASGSSAILAEFVHSVVDSGNQALLLVGLRDSQMAADKKHPYGYGKSIYFWALVSALGTFFLGAGVSMTHAIGDLMDPRLHEITWHVWAVLAVSFGVDGYVFTQTVQETLETKPKDVSYWKHVSNIRDPATLAVLLEDGAACLGIVMAAGGIILTHATGNPIFDGVAGVGISFLLGAMGVALVRVNHRFLLGQGVDRDITDHIEKILLSRRSVDGIGSVQSQWTGPESFSYKAEVDFDGTYIAAKLMPIYQQEFVQIRDSMDEELQVLLALYAEDVIRTTEREIRHVEAHIRKQYPGAEFIELEPMSTDVDRLAIDDNLEADLRRVESAALSRYLKSLKKEEASGKPSSDNATVPPSDRDA